MLEIKLLRIYLYVFSFSYVEVCINKYRILHIKIITVNFGIVQEVTYANTNANNTNVD